MAQKYKIFFTLHSSFFIFYYLCTQLKYNMTINLKKL